MEGKDFNSIAVSLAIAFFTEGAQQEKSTDRLPTFQMERLCFGKSEWWIQIKAKRKHPKANKCPGVKVRFHVKTWARDPFKHINILQYDWRCNFHHFTNTCHWEEMFTSRRLGGGSVEEDISLVLRAKSEKERVELQSLMISWGLGILPPWAEKLRFLQISFRKIKTPFKKFSLSLKEKRVDFNQLSNSLVWR